MLANNDLANAISNIDVPMVALDKNLRIRFLNPRGHEIFSLNQSGVGRPITELGSTVAIAGPDKMVSDAITNMTTKEQDVAGRSGVWHSVRVRPYKTSGVIVEGVVLTLMNIDELKGLAANQVSTAWNNY
jgi:two-component system CheB/CheR fusion protein